MGVSVFLCKTTVLSCGFRVFTEVFFARCFQWLFDMHAFFVRFTGRPQANTLLIG